VSGLGKPEDLTFGPTQSLDELKAELLERQNVVDGGPWDPWSGSPTDPPDDGSEWMTVVCEDRYVHLRCLSK
jgi:hypothetical protein